MSNDCLKYLKKTKDISFFKPPSTIHLPTAFSSSCLHTKPQLFEGSVHHPPVIYLLMECREQKHAI